MALTFDKTFSDFDTANAGDQRGGVRRVCGTITFDDSYPTGGEAVTAADLDPKASSIVSLQLTARGATVATQARWDEATGKILLFVCSTGVQAADASDQSDTSVHFDALCR